MRIVREGDLSDDELFHDTSDCKVYDRVIFYPLPCYSLQIRLRRERTGWLEHRTALLHQLEKAEPNEQALQDMGSC